MAILSSADWSREEALPVYQLEWMPEGFKAAGFTATSQMVTEAWSRETQADGQPRVRTHFRWYYSLAPQAVPAGTPETGTVNGAEAQYWAADPSAEPSTVSTGGKVLSISSTEAQMNTLLWTDPEMEIRFFLQGHLDREDLLHMAENLRQSTGENPAEAGT